MSVVKDVDLEATPTSIFLTDDDDVSHFRPLTVLYLTVDVSPRL